MAAVERAQNEIEEMGHAWTHGPESTHACRLCSIERKSGFPEGHLNDRDRRRYWVKKDRREKKAGREAAEARGHTLPSNHPFAKDRSITPTVPPKKKSRKPAKQNRRTVAGQRKTSKNRKKK